MADSPQVGAEGVPRISVLSNGEPIAETVRLSSVSVQRAANTAPSARIVVDDGDIETGAWPVADGATFAPGAEIAIKAGYGDRQDTIFEGIVVKLGVSLSAENESRLIVDCQDKAVRMTLGRRSANYVDMADSAIFAQLGQRHGLDVSTDATNVTHKALAQSHCSDWDFMIARAEANGLLVIVADGQLSAKAPATDVAAALEVTRGVDLIAFDAEIDARTQLASVEAAAWDPGTQDVVRGVSAGPAALTGAGNLDSATLARVAGPDIVTLRTAAALDPGTLSGWARAQQVKAGLARLRGRMTFQGSAKARVGGLIDLKGMGARYSGPVFVGALEHRIEDGGWVTEVEFGLPMVGDGVRAELTAGASPGIRGLQIGVVMANHDPAGQHRILVRAPVLEAESPGLWARQAQPLASSGFGAVNVPDVGDEVVLGYFNDDPTHPVILGSLYSSRRAPPEALTAGHDITALVTRCGARIEVDDQDKVVTITTPANNRVVLSDKDGSVVLQDRGGSRVTVGPVGVTLESPGDIRISAQGTLTLEATGSLSMSSKADLKATGLNITCDAELAFAGKGAASAELSASGQTTVRGTMVMIN